MCAAWQNDIQSRGCKCGLPHVSGLQKWVYSAGHLFAKAPYTESSNDVQRPTDSQKHLMGRLGSGVQTPAVSAGDTADSAAGGAAGGAAIVGGIPVAPAGGAVLGINELATSIKQSIFCCIFWVDTLFGLIL